MIPYLNLKLESFKGHEKISLTKCLKLNLLLVAFITLSGCTPDQGAVSSPGSETLMEEQRGQPSISFNPGGPIALLNLTVGSASAPINFTVSNSARQSISSCSSASLSGANLDDFVLLGADSCLSGVPGRGSCSGISVIAKPMSAGAKSISLNLECGSLSKSVLISYLAEAVVSNPSPANLTFNPAGSVALAATTVGLTSASQSFSAQNSGDLATGSCSAASLSGANASEFLIAGASSCNAGILGKATCAGISVAAKPLSAGSKSASLNLVCGSLSKSVSLSYSASTALLPATLSFNPAGPIALAATVVGSTSAAQAFSAQNSGDLATSTCSAASLSGTNASEFLITGASSCNAGILGKASCAGISVAAKPLSAGAKAASLNLVCGSLSKSVSLTFSATASVPAPVAGLTTVAPLVSNLEFRNPERGFSKYSKLTSFTQSKATSIASAGFSLSGVQVVVPTDAILSSTFIDLYKTMFTYARSAGIKLVITHRYHDIHDFVSDPSQAVILGHIDQLFPIIATNIDVVFNTHVGFLGAYGEMYYSQWGKDFNFIRQMTQKMLDYIPAGHHVSLRTPGMKVKSFAMTAPFTTSNSAYSSQINRVGHWNDCYLASASDQGTNGDYSLSSPSDWRDFVGQEASAKSLPVGGETCAVSAYSGCSNALIQTARQKWTYMNHDYLGTVYTSWQAPEGTCYDEIRRNLGFRLRVNQFKYQAAVSRATNLDLEMIIENVGYAAPVHSRPVKLVLFNSSGEYKFDLGLNPVSWKTGSYTISKAIAMASVPVGTYSVALQLPDAAASIQNNPAYAIQLANQGTWDATKGWNVIKNGSSAIQIQVNN